MASGPFSLNLSTIYFGHILEWVAGGMTLDEMEAHTHYGFALSFLGVVKPAHREQVRERMLGAQRTLCRRRGRSKRRA